MLMIYRMLKKFDSVVALKGVVSVFLALMLAACGGAASTASNTPALTLSLVDASGKAVSALVAGTSYTLIATATQTGGAASNVIVTFSGGSLGTLNPSSGSSLTDSSGVATIVFVPNAAGASTASASASVKKITTTAATTTAAATSTTTFVTVADSLNYGVTAASAGSSVTSLALSLVDAGNNPVTTMTLGTNYRLIAMATDTTGSAATNTIVTFSPSSSATLIPTAGTALTNGSGVAQIVMVPGTPGASTASASFTSSLGNIVTKSINFNITPTPTTTLGTLTPASSSVTSAGTTTLSVNTLVNQALTAGVSVLFSTTCGQITTTNPATSNSAGVATATYSSVTAGGTLCTGAVTVQASAGGSTAFANLTVASPVITLTSFAASPSSIASAANSALSLTVLSNGAVPTSSVSVALAATCGQVSPSVATTNGSGVISATYSSVKSDGTLCSVTDTIAATTTGATATTSITVASPTTGSISFVSASPAQIFLSNSGAASTTTLSFKSLFSTGAVAPSTSVTFTLTGNPGGVTFGTSGNTAPYTVTSDSAGVATVLVYAGNVPGAITIKAEWFTNSGVTTTSNGLTVSSGAAQQKSMSLSATVITLDADNFDGDTTQITARIADANGNPVPDGTVVNFVSSGGQINRSCSTTTANSGGLNATGFSQCSVTLMGQSFKPTNGRVTVLAYLEGIKNYTDSNGNGVFDTGETLSDQGDAYRDDNENGVYDSGEFVIAKGGTGICTGSSTAKVNTCTGLLSTTVRAKIVLLFASNAPYVTVDAGQSTKFTTSAAASFTFTLNGLTKTLLPMPKGTTISATAVKTGCTASSIYPSSVSDTGAGTNPLTNIGTPVSIILKGTAAVAAVAATTTTPAVAAVPEVACQGSQLIIQTTAPVSGQTYTYTTTVP
jgi:hypothetical protein